MREKTTPKGRKQIKVFMEGVLAETLLEKARQLSGIDTPARNQTAFKLILGHGGVHIYPEDSGTTVFPPILPTERPELVVQGCLYGKFIARILLLCCHDECGGIQKATDDMMRRYLSETKKDLTLEN
ncbi:hypothetical protein PMG11_01919 [Penicillium brasilianum]|uniref:Uncharacterized protein n=1 Tax=Penicillium brasilianum TaxID=104259 RepID=A0A0F7TJN0_PENBI|nr:hypothetical protein PMG11_01919 [Penicillium brasilianum]